MIQYDHRFTNLIDVNKITDMDKDAILCTCNEITCQEVENAIRQKKLKTIEEVGNETTAGTICGGCVDEIYLLLEKINGKVLL